jgi:hypothetical protein
VEVDLEKGLGDLGGEPDPVEGEGLVAGEAEALEVDEGSVGLPAEGGGRVGVLAAIEGEDLVGLGDALGLDEVEEAEEAADRLGELGWSDGGAPAPATSQAPFGHEAAEGLADGLAGDAVGGGELGLGRQAVGELAVVEASTEVLEELLPEGFGALTIEDLTARRSAERGW